MKSSILNIKWWKYRNAKMVNAANRTPNLNSKNWMVSL